MQRTSCEMSGWMNHRQGLRLLEEISTNFRYVDVCVSVAQSYHTLCDPVDCSLAGSSVCICRYVDNTTLYISVAMQVIPL